MITEATLLSSSTSEKDRPRRASDPPRFWMIAGVTLGTLFAVFVAFAQGQVPAVYKMHEIEFTYRSRATFLPCHELQASVANILRGVGARDDVQVHADGCDELWLPQESIHDPRRDRWDRFERPGDSWSVPPNERFHDPHRARREQSSRVRARVMMPVEVTPEVRQEMERDKSRRELISRVTRNPAAALNDPTVFPAQRQQITLSRRTMRLAPEDCEVLDQMRGVFRDLDVRVVDGSLSCRSRITPELTVETLVPVALSTPASTTGAGTGPAVSHPDPAAPTPSTGESSEEASETAK